MNKPPLAWKPSEGTELFRTLAETTSAAIFILEDLQIRYANPAAALITQYAEDELLGMDFSGLAAPSYRGVLRSRGLTGGWSADIPQRFELKLLCKDGTEKWVDLTAGSTAVEGHPAIVVTALDITGRDEAEQALRSANQLLEERVKQRTVEILIERQRLATVLQTQPAAVVISDAVGRVVERNEMADLIWGGAAPPLDTLDDYQRYQGWLAETGSELRTEDWPLVRAVRASETVIGVVIDIQRADGSRGTLLVSAAPVYDGEGNKLGGVAVAQDITAQREMERKARQEAAQLDVIFDSIDDAVVLYRADGIVERANAAARRVYGFDPTGRSQREIIREIIFHSLDGRELAPDEIPSTRALTGERVSRAALIMTNPAGRESWVEVSTAPLYSAGKLTSVVVVWHDIMDREKLLAELEAGQSRLNATLQSAPEAIVTLDVQGNILLANPAARELFGQALPEPGERLEAGVVRFLRTDGTAYVSGEMPILNAAVSGLPVSNLELVIELQENRRRTVQASAAPVLDSRGRPAGAVAVFQDITQLKHSEAAVRRETERLELLSSLSQAIGEAGLYYPAVLSTIAQKISESIGDGCVIRLVSDDGQWLDPVAFHHADPEVFGAYRTLLHATRKRVDEGYSGYVYKTGESLIILDMTQDELMNVETLDLASLAAKFPVQNGLIVPLRAQNRFIGTLSVFRSHIKAPFASEDKAFLQDLADRAALAIENARLYAAEAQRARELDALHKAASALLSTLDLDELLGQILDAAQNAIPTADKGLLHLVSPETNDLHVRAMLGYQNPRVQKISAAKDQRYLYQVAKERRSILIHDLQADSSAPLREEGSAPEQRSVVAAPLILENSVLGVLSLSSTSPSAFGEADLRLLESLAATTTAAIQNALLHTEVQRLAITDSLTGLYNRRGFLDLGQREIERFHRFERTLSAIMLDIDHFKEINDSYGHAVGDQVLATLARRCRMNIRHVDILGRVGGEEFAILLPETDLFTAADIAERIRRSIAEEPFMTGHEPLSVTISLGITRTLPDTPDLESLLDRADAALYRAKQGGRNRVEIA